MRVILFLSFLLLATCSWEGKLQFDQNNTFTILQLTDMHFAESTIGDLRTIGIQYKLISEIKPDLVVLSGDMFSGDVEQCLPPKKDCFEQSWHKFTFALRQLKQRYAIILGNHDAQADLTRKQIIELDMTSPYSLTQQSPEGVSDGSNYFLPIHDSEGQQVESLIWMFDSHDDICQGKYSPSGCVEQDQIQWFNEEYQNQLQQNQREILQSISFVHIPPPEYITLVNEQETYGNVREKVCCPCQNTGLVDAMMENDVSANYSGHDHSNDFGGIFHKNNKKIELQYGRKSGFNSYGPPKDMMRGGQVITIKSLGNGRITVDSYIQDELGLKIQKGEATKKDSKMSDCAC